MKLDPFDNLFAKKALRPKYQEQHRDEVRGPGFYSTTNDRPQLHLSQLLAGSNNQPADNGTRNGVKSPEDQDG